jgi:hypothetical protein
MISKNCHSERSEESMVMDAGGYGVGSFTAFRMTPIDSVFLFETPVCSYQR